MDKQQRGEVTDSAHVGDGVTEREEMSDLTAEEAAVQAVKLQLLTLLLCECNGRLIGTSEAVTCRLSEHFELHWCAEDQSGLLAQSVAGAHRFADDGAG